MDNVQGMPVEDGDVFVLSTNPFGFIYRDAEDFLRIAETVKDRNAEARFARNAVLLFVVAAEALINRVLESLTSRDFPASIKDKIRDLPLDMKWYMAPLWCATKQQPPAYELDREPFQSFRELISIRNRYVHPLPLKMPLELKDARHKRFDYVGEEVPRWPQTKIPKDLNHFDKKAAKAAKDAVDAMIDQLDQFLDGKIKQDDWWLTETMTKRKKKDE